MADKFRIPVAFAAVTIWALITIWGVWTPHDPTTLSAGLVNGPAWQIIGAGAFLLILVLVMQWTDIGFNAPRPWSSLRVLIFPAIYIAVFVTGSILVGFPAPSILFFLGLNTLAVGFSEEIAFRGVLFHALRTRLSLWPAIWITSVLFGSVHVINGFTTGDFLGAAIQAVTAFMSGVFFMALMLSTRSIVPSMFYHGIWDFLLLTITSGAMAQSAASAPREVHLWMLFIPLFFVLPNFLYGLFLLRKVEDAEPVQSAPA